MTSIILAAAYDCLGLILMLSTLLSLSKEPFTTVLMT